MSRGLLFYFTFSVVTSRDVCACMTVLLRGSGAWTMQGRTWIGRSGLALLQSLRRSPASSHPRAEGCLAGRLSCCHRTSLPVLSCMLQQHSSLNFSNAISSCLTCLFLACTLTSMVTVKIVEQKSLGLPGKLFESPDTAPNNRL